MLLQFKITVFYAIYEIQSKIQANSKNFFLAAITYYIIITLHIIYNRSIL